MMIAPCGFRCDRCVAFATNAKTHADRVRGSAAWARYYQLQVAPQRIQCHGCLPGRVAGLDFPDARCEIRPCARGRGLETCADCAEYPCGVVAARMASCDEAVHRFRGSIPAADFERFIAPYDCRATLENIRKTHAAGPTKTGAAKDR